MNQQSTIIPFPSFSAAVEQRDVAELGLAAAAAIIDLVRYAVEAQEYVASLSDAKSAAYRPGELATRSIAIALDAAWSQIEAVRGGLQ